MSDRNDKRTPGRQPAEGVRIIGAEEAQAALEAGEAAGRRPGDQPKFGDVPPVPSGPRPAHRFPLPDSVDPAEVARPHVSPPRLPAEPASRLPAEPASRLPAEPTYRLPAEPPPPPPPPAPPASSLAPLPPPSAAPPSPAPPSAAPSPVTPPSADRLWGPEHDIEIGERTTELGVPDRGSDSPTYPAPQPYPDPAPLALPEEGITVTGGGTDLPHWTDPPTGEVPRILSDDAYGDEDANEEDLEAWRALGARGIRWRDAEDDWDDADEIADLAGDEDPIGALDQTRSAQSDLYSFDEDFERVAAARGGAPSDEQGYDETEDDYEYQTEYETEPEPEPVAVRTRTSGATSRARHGRIGIRSGVSSGTPPRSRPARRGGGGGGGGGSGGGGDDDMGSRVAVGVGLVAVLIIAYFVGPAALTVLVGLIAVASAAEGYGMLQRAGFKPATLLGLVATIGVVAGAYWQGLSALPLAMVLVFAGSMMWYILRIVEARPLANVAVTTMVFVWVGILASYGALLLRQPDHAGRKLFLGAILVAVAADIFAFVVGRWIGSRPMAASISPNKTLEGFIGGLIGAVVVGAIVGKEIHVWGGGVHGVILGLAVGIIAPAGDLFESMIKRDLGVKDSGSILPGHGGLLDRFDSVLFALPTAYYVATCFHVITTVSH